MALHVVILAAGQGKRMFSGIPKILHSVAGKPMLQRVVDTALELKPEAVHIIYGHEGNVVRECLGHLPVQWIEQKEQAGTGHALLQALPFIPDEAQVMVLYGDVPLVKLETLQSLLEISSASNHPALSLLLANVDNPEGLGRILRDQYGNIIRIVEERDTNTEQKAIKEIYTGICCVSKNDLQRWLPSLNNHNEQKEYLLTDIIAIARAENYPLMSITISETLQIRGVNNRLQLQMVERACQKSMAEKLLLSGTTLADADRLDIRGELVCGKDVFIDINCIFEGNVTLGDNCFIGPHCYLKDVTLGANTRIHANSVLEGCRTENDCQIGPFARIRPGTELASHCKIGNFVEAKNAHFGENSKASHLSYMGDVHLGSDVNIGAGTITCNYDGANKHQTTIGDNVHVGSDTQLVAPVTVGNNATIGAGSTIRKNVPPDALTLTESKQRTVYEWKRPVKK